MTVRIGGLQGPGRAEVDGRGRITPVGAGWSLEWSIGADDRWRDPRREVAIRQRLLDGMPVVETALRVPSGDARLCAWAVGSVAHVQVSNDSPAAFALAWFVRAGGRGRHRIEVDRDGTVIVDGSPAVSLAPRAYRWATATDPGVADATVVAGDASQGPFRAVEGRGYAEAAFLVPVPHRSGGTGAIVFLDGRRWQAQKDPGPERAARGWREVLAVHGMRAELPDSAVQAALDSARAQLLLHDAGRSEIVAVLEDWGFDQEAVAAWARLGLRARRAAARRRLAAAGDAAWAAVRAALDAVGDPVPVLRAVRDLLLAEPRPDEVRLLAVVPPGWRGQELEVHEAPTRAGAVSYAVRWHGDRPALLWEAPTGIRLSAPGLAPSWSTVEPSGEALL